MSCRPSRSISDGGVDTSFAAKFARILGCTTRSDIESLPPIKLQCPKSPTHTSDHDSKCTCKCSDGINIIGSSRSSTATTEPGQGKSANRLSDLSRSAPPEGKMHFSPHKPTNFHNSSRRHDDSSNRRQDDKHLLDTIARCLTDASMHKPLNLNPASEKRLVFTPVTAQSVTNVEGDVSTRPLRMTNSSPLLKHEASSSPCKCKTHSLRLCSRRSMDSGSHKFLETILQITAETNVRAGSKYNCGGVEHRQMTAAAPTSP